MSTQKEIELIKTQALKFSKALEPIAVRDNIIILGGRGERRFPRAGCAKASRLFGHLLLEKKVFTNLILSKFCNDHEIEHTWLEHEGCIIDLTCCQFDGLPRRTTCEYFCSEPRCGHTEELPPIPKCPYECPFISGTGLEWYSDNWPKELRESKNIRTTHLTENEQNILKEIEMSDR